MSVFVPRGIRQAVHICREALLLRAWRGESGSHKTILQQNVYFCDPVILATVTEKFIEKLNLSSYALYLSDIGSSVGFRLAVMHPERVTAMIVQNGDAHVEVINKEFSKGLFDYWEDRSEKNAQVLLDWLLTIEGTKWHYLNGVRDPSRISPDNWVIDQANQDRPGNKDIQLSILYNAKRNLDVYADWQAYFRKKQP